MVRHGNWPICNRSLFRWEREDKVGFIIGEQKPWSFVSLFYICHHAPNEAAACSRLRGLLFQRSIHYHRSKCLRFNIHTAPGRQSITSWVNTFRWKCDISWVKKSSDSQDSRKYWKTGWESHSYNLLGVQHGNRQLLWNVLTKILIYAPKNWLKPMS